jgi:DegV family protein with EDD domain
MTQVRIVTDSLADIPAEILQELDITAVPCAVRFGETTFRDKIDLSAAEFYQKLVASPILPTTSQPPAGAFEEVYRSLALETNALLSIHVIGSLSGTFNAASLAAKNVPQIQIEVLDSQQVSMGLGWIVIGAARAAQADKSLAEVKAVAEDLMRRTRIVAMLDTLEYAQRGGRLGRGAALVGSLLNVKPLLTVLDGSIEPVENVRTQRRGLDRLIELVAEGGPIEELSVIHAGALELAQRVKKMAAAMFPEEKMVLSEAGPVLGTYTGPGAVGIAWVTRRRDSGSA